MTDKTARTSAEEDAEDEAGPEWAEAEAEVVALAQRIRLDEDPEDEDDEAEHNVSSSSGLGSLQQQHPSTRMEDVGQEEEEEEREARAAKNAHLPWYQQPLISSTSTAAHLPDASTSSGHLQQQQPQQPVCYNQPPAIADTPLDLFPDRLQQQQRQQQQLPRPNFYAASEQPQNHHLAAKGGADVNVKSGGDALPPPHNTAAVRNSSSGSSNGRHQQQQHKHFDYDPLLDDARAAAPTASGGLASEEQPAPASASAAAASRIRRNNVAELLGGGAMAMAAAAAPAQAHAPAPTLQLQSNAVGMYNWQATKMTVKERLAFMFNNEVLSDVHFIVGRDAQEQRIPGHKFVLSVGSAVFDAMFNSTLATREEEITLPDVEPASFLALLKFLYSDEVQIGPDTVMTTLYTAKKYAVPALEKHCVDFLKGNLSADNAFMLLTQARLFDEPQLAALCLETIDKYTPEALSAEGFTDIDIDTLSAVLDRDSLRIKEAKLFSAVLRWSEAECLRQGLPVSADNKRSVLGHVLTKIRFPLMTVEEFAQGPAQSKILSDRECVSLFLHFTVNPKPPVAFLDIPRCSMTGKEQTVCRFVQVESRWGYSGTSDKIRFIVDRRIFVIGFGLYGSIHGPSEYQVLIQLIHTGSARLLGSNEASFQSDGTNSTFRVMFKEPVEVMPNTNYTASCTLKGLDSHYGTKGLRKVWVDCPTGGRVTFQFSYAAGNNNGTSVEDGQIPEIIFYT